MALLFSCQFCKIFQSIYFTERLWTTACRHCNNGLFGNTKRVLGLTKTEFKELDYKWALSCHPIWHGLFWASKTRGGVVWKKVILEISQNSQENTCARVFFNKVAGPCNFIKKETVTQVFFREFYKISKTTFFTEYLWMTASEIQHKIISVGDHWLFYSHPVFHDIWRLRHKSSRKEVYQNFSIFITISAIISSNFYIHLKP